MSCPVSRDDDAGADRVVAPEVAGNGVHVWTSALAPIHAGPATNGLTKSQ